MAAAGQYDAVVVVAGTDASTAYARTTTAARSRLPGAQASMISQVEAANPNTIVYLETVGEVDTSPFQSTTPALLWSSYNGQRQGAALADVLLGKVNPSGHLPFTWYANDSQIPAISDYKIRPTATTDGRTYQYFTGNVSCPFGYGLSYANFSYSAPMRGSHVGRRQRDDDRTARGDQHRPGGRGHRGAALRDDASTPRPRCSARRSGWRASRR